MTKHAETWNGRTQTLRERFDFGGTKSRSQIETTRSHLCTSFLYGSRFVDTACHYFFVQRTTMDGCESINNHIHCATYSFSLSRIRRNLHPTTTTTTTCTRRLWLAATVCSSVVDLYPAPPWVCRMRGMPPRYPTTRPCRYVYCLRNNAVQMSIRNLVSLN